ncbi:methyltransferase domain-containing protein [Galactobacter sp.]|uniref:SAM-dependent methyltransferase n=1 Tax=Galactobacter sp. TaxID=2676125 RepID=UPI0025BFDE99|nr:methyltransferase domain-containing protein [Galactobacter sp.]
MVDLPPLYDDLTFLSPLSDERAASLVGFIADAHPDTVLDIGCDWGELLLRSLAAVPEARGLGVDLESQHLEDARRRAVERGLADWASFDARDARTFTGSFDAVVCIGASQIWGPQVDEEQPLDYTAALVALRQLLPAGGRLVYGEAVWSVPPTAAAMSALGGRPDEYLAVDSVVALARQHGFSVANVEVATQGEWDAFEAGFRAGFEHWIHAHPADHEDQQEVHRQLQDQRDRYMNGYRGVLGMAYLSLIAD